MKGWTLCVATAWQLIRGIASPSVGASFLVRSGNAAPAETNRQDNRRSYAPNPLASSSLPGYDRGMRRLKTIILAFIIVVVFLQASIAGPMLWKIPAEIYAALSAAIFCGAIWLVVRRTNPRRN